MISCFACVLMIFTSYIFLDLQSREIYKKYLQEEFYEKK